MNKSICPILLPKFKLFFINWCSFVFLLVTFAMVFVELLHRIVGSLECNVDVNVKAWSWRTFC